MSHSRRRPRLADPRLRQTVETGLRLGWSPKIIAGSLEQLHKGPQISHEAICQWIYADARHLTPCLVRGHRRRRHRAKIPWEKVFIPQQVSVNERTTYANDRSEPGHWKADYRRSFKDRGLFQEAPGTLGFSESTTHGHGAESWGAGSFGRQAAAPSSRPRAK